MACLRDTDVDAFVAGTLDGERLAAVDEHLDGCADCRELVRLVRQAAAAQLVASAGGGIASNAVVEADGSDELLPIGSTVGRFVIEGELGRGAMGLVYAARDPRLSRTVALKLLRPDRQGRADDGATLLEEAVAMAQLAHPNVVAIYEAGELADGEGEVYLAMERIPGSTLAEWVSNERAVPRVIKLMTAVGRGLAAAHAAGICHRDFKPDNVLVGDDGRPRVSDFGLARARRVGNAGGFVAALRQTQSSIGGTPAYMAPEVFAGEVATAKSDQYSYCVTFFEALTGKRPFEGDDIEELAAAALRGRYTWPSRPRVPRRVREVIDRGLRAAADQRWPSVDALLEALESATSGWKRRWIAGVAAAGLAIAGVSAALALALGGGAPDSGALCAGAASPVEPVWNAERASALRQVAGKAAFAADVTAARIDSYVDRWRAQSEQSCRDTRVLATQSTELLDRRSACLRRRLSELDAVISQLEAGGAQGALEGPRWVARLTDPASCGDIEALLAAVPLPADPGVREQVAGVQAAIDRNLTRDQAGESDAAYVAMKDLLARAEALGYDPLIAEALQSLAAVEQSLRKLDDASAHLDRALEVASRAKDHARVANISVGKLYFYGAMRQDFAAAKALVEPARAAVMQAGAEPEQLVSLHLNAGLVYDLSSEQDRAAAEFEEALEILRESKQSESARASDVLHNLGAMTLDSGDVERSLDYFRRALRLRERLYGTDHPEVATTLLGLGALARRTKDLAAAREHYQRAAKIYERAYGPDHAQLGAVENNLAIVETVDGNHQRAIEHHRRALKIRTAAYGPEHPLVAQSHGGLANALAAAGKRDEALVHGRLSMELREKAYPAGHTSIAIGKHNFAELLSEMGEHREAATLRAEALEIFAAKKFDPIDMAEVQFSQARDLWALGRRGPSRKLARKAIAGYRTAGETGAEGVAKIDAWLKSH